MLYPLSYWGVFIYQAILSNFLIPVKQLGENVCPDIEISPLHNYRFGL